MHLDDGPFSSIPGLPACKDRVPSPQAYKGKNQSLNRVSE